MRITLSLLITLFVVAVACNKDKFQTKPTLSIKSTSGDFVGLNESFQITLECTDKEGDVQDSIFFVKRRLNKNVRATVRDTLRYAFPVFPSKQRTEIIATFTYQDILSAQSPPFIPGSNPPQRELDTIILKIAAKDRAGNISDTVISQPIHVYRQ